MKKLYWRPVTVSRKLLLLMAAVSLVGMGAVQWFRPEQKLPYYEEKLAASLLARAGMEILKTARLERGLEIDAKFDPAGSGLIGVPFSPVTSDPGLLWAKQTSVNPNFAAVMVRLLAEAGVERGDTVAVGATGSFPALNVSVYAAIETLELEPVVISSAAASQWGANLPEFLWIHMERVLEEEGTFSFRSVAASPGGAQDRGLGMPPEGVTMLRSAIERNELELIEPSTPTESIDRRMELFGQHAAAPIRAYINIGGGVVSVGSPEGKRMFDPGLNLAPPPGAATVDSVMSRFSLAGVPVIHLVQVNSLAARYGLPLQPTTTPEPGQGSVYARPAYSRWLAAAVLLGLLIMWYIVFRTEVDRLVLPNGPARPMTDQEPIL